MQMRSTPPVRPAAPRRTAMSEGFRFDCPRAREVYLVGDFNGWRFPGLPMTRTAGPTWTVRVALSPGPHLITCYAVYSPHNEEDDPHGERCWPAQMMKVVVGAPERRDTPSLSGGRWSWGTRSASTARLSSDWIDLLHRDGGSGNQPVPNPPPRVPRDD